MSTPTPKFCYHGNAMDCCDACDREEVIGKLERDLAAAREEAKTLLAKLLHAEALLVGCSAYLKDGETPAERIKREIADCAAITRLYAAALKERDAAHKELERVRDKCNEHYMALAAAREARRQWEDELVASMNRQIYEAVQRAQRAEAIAEKIKQILLPDPHDEREVSAEWQVKAIHAAIDAAREGK